MRPDPLSPYDVSLIAARLGAGARELALEARRLADLTATPALTGTCGAALRRCGAGLAAELSALARRAELAALPGGAR